MPKVVNLKDFEANRAMIRGQRLWKNRFPEKLTAQTRLADLSDQTLYTLALLGQEGLRAIHDLIMGALNLEPGPDFNHLDRADKMAVLDTSLFLTDQIRWEMLARLGLVKGYAAEEYTLAQLILDQTRIKAEFRPPFPELLKTHPQYAEFNRRRNLDGEVMIRSMIPAALAAFARRI